MGRYRIGDDELDPIEQRIVTDVDRYGWHCMYLLGDEELVPYAYSIGLHHSHGHPELSVFALEFDEARDLIAELVERVKGGERLDAGDVQGGPPDEERLTFAPVDQAWYEDFFGRGIDFYGTLDFPMLQCVWSDESGRFPWDSGFDPELQALQPNLAVAPD